jgi:hypothetical protein
MHFGAQHTAEKWRIEQSHLVRIRGCGLSPWSIKPLEIHFHRTFAQHPVTHLFSLCGCLSLQVSAIHHILCSRTRTKLFRLLPYKRLCDLFYYFPLSLLPNCGKYNAKCTCNTFHACAFQYKTSVWILCEKDEFAIE